LAIVCDFCIFITKWRLSKNGKKFSKNSKGFYAFKGKNRADVRRLMSFDNDDYFIDKVKFKTSPNLEKYKKTAEYKELCIRK